jgi:hypothetical protein
LQENASQLWLCRPSLLLENQRTKTRLPVNAAYVSVQQLPVESTLRVALGTLSVFSAICAMNHSKMMCIAYMINMFCTKRASITVILRDASYAAEFSQDHTLLKHLAIFIMNLVSHASDAIRPSPNQRLSAMLMVSLCAKTASVRNIQYV